MRKMARYWAWDYVASKVEEDYGGYVDWDEHFYICPECGEPILRADYDHMKSGTICPVCEFEEEE